MLSDVQLATVRAALRYWREEMCPHGADTAAGYFSQPIEEYLLAEEVSALERRFDDTAVRYVAFNGRTERIAAPMLFADARIARRLVNGEVCVGTLILA